MTLLSSFKAQNEVGLFLNRPFSPAQNKASRLLQWTSYSETPRRIEIQAKENTGIDEGHTGA